MHTIGKILKTIREERGLQLRQVAIESNIDLTLLSRVENGKRMPSESLLIKLAETYGLDSNLLVLQLVSDKIFNDLLCANRVIYQGFFEKGEWNRDKLCTILDEYNHTDCNSLEDNYFSINFGGKYFDYGVSKLIGYVRQNIEDRRGELTDKEYNILLSTLIYNMDRIANTVGHFDAYIQGKEIEKKSLTLRLIDARSYDNVAIYQENSNTLARTLHADIVYIL